MELFHIFLSGTPHRTQPVEVDIRILEDKEVGDRVTVISQCRRVVELAVRITRLEINAQCPRNLLLGGNHGGDTLETCIGENPFVLSVGDGRPYAAPVGFSGQGYRVGQGISRLKQIFAVVFVRYPGSGYRSTILCHRVILVEQPVGVEACSVGTTGSAGACVTAVFRFPVRVIGLAFVDRTCRTDIARQSLSEFILVIGPSHHIVNTEVTAVRHTDTFGCTRSRFGSHHNHAIGCTRTVQGCRTGPF